MNKFKNNNNKSKRIQVLRRNQVFQVLLSRFLVWAVHSLPASIPQEGIPGLCCWKHFRLPGQPCLGQAHICVSVKVPGVTQGKEKLHIPQVHSENQSKWQKLHHWSSFLHRIQRNVLLILPDVAKRGGGFVYLPPQKTSLGQWWHLILNLILNQDDVPAANLGGESFLFILWILSSVKALGPAQIAASPQISVEKGGKKLFVMFVRIEVTVSFPFKKPSSAGVSFWHPLIWGICWK